MLYRGIEASTNPFENESQKFGQQYANQGAP